MNCNSKHTQYDPTVDEFNCPKCGAKSGDFCIYESYGVEECDKLHVADFLLCFKCGYETTGSKFSSHIIKKNNMVQCKCCNGKGWVVQQGG